MVSLSIENDLIRNNILVIQGLIESGGIGQYLGDIQCLFWLRLKTDNNIENALVCTDNETDQTDGDQHNVLP